MFPVFGQVVSKSVEMVKPLLQQFLEVGPLVHVEIGDDVVDVLVVDVEVEVELDCQLSFSVAALEQGTV